MTDLTARLRALADAATPGPWYVWTDTLTSGNLNRGISQRGNDEEAIVQDEWFPPEDAAFIAAARNGIVELCDEVERLEGENDFMQGGQDVCAHCGFTTPRTRDDAEIRAHVETCPKHPLAAARKRIAELEDELTARTAQRDDWQTTARTAVDERNRIIERNVALEAQLAAEQEASYVAREGWRQLEAQRDAALALCDQHFPNDDTAMIIEDIREALTANRRDESGESARQNHNESVMELTITRSIEAAAEGEGLPEPLQARQVTANVTEHGHSEMSHKPDIKADMSRLSDMCACGHERDRHTYWNAGVLGCAECICTGYKEDS